MKHSYKIFGIEHYHRYRYTASKALERPLPEGCVVHHHTYRPQQLVICEDHAYHMLLHVRMRALKACGHAGWRKCTFCKSYDKPESLVFNKGGGIYHKNCYDLYLQLMRFMPLKRKRHTQSIHRKKQMQWRKKILKIIRSWAL